MRGLFQSLSLLGLAATASAQQNVIAGLDIQLYSIDDARVLGRLGTYPDGVNGFAFATTICNTGTAGVTWKPPMDEVHPFIAFLVAREANGRLEQISNRSYIKHTFGSSNTSICATCTDTSNPNVLAVGCSDTYHTDENGDRYWLGPPEELDPWLSVWSAACSYIDRGDPPALPPEDCDGFRSLSDLEVALFDPIKNRCQVTDADFGTAGALFYVAGTYFVLGEADALRDDSCGTYEIVPAWNGTNWDFTFNGGNQHGSILGRWAGATIDSNSNGNEDGRVFIARLVTGPDANGVYHYEYAIHNRDNARGIASFRLPVAPGATITNAGFRDLDADATNDWTFTAGTAEVEWSTTTNPIEWNTFFNFWLDADVAPADGARALVTEFRPGAGFDRFDVTTTAPAGPVVGTRLGYGLPGGDGVYPDLSMSGNLDAGQAVQCIVRYAAPSAFAFAFLGTDNTGFDYRGGRIVPFPPAWIVPCVMDQFGQVLFDYVSVGGTFDLFMQIAVIDPSAPQAIELSNALEIQH